MINREKANGVRLRSKKYTALEIEQSLCFDAPLENYVVSSNLISFFTNNSWMHIMCDDEFFIAAKHYLEVIGAPVFHCKDEAKKYMDNFNPG